MASSPLTPGRVGLVVPMEGTRRRRPRKAVWDPTEYEDSRPQWREALTTRLLYHEVSKQHRCSVQVCELYV